VRETGAPDAIGVDVFIPCYNYGHFLASCVESALSQEGCRVRVLIIDDASTDASLAVARRIAASDPRVEVLAHEVNKGHIATYNDGIAWASADYVTLVSADDLLAPMALARATCLMEANPRVGFTFGRLAHFTDEAGIADQIQLARTQGHQVSASIRAGGAFVREICEHPWNPVAASGVVVRTALQKKVGGYLPELPHAGDLEMWLRLAAHADLATIAATQCFTRLHASNMRHSYYADRMIDDYRQRQLAFELFFERQAAVLGDQAALAPRARRALAAEVLSGSGRCFDEADEAAGARLAELAKSIDPSILGTPYWWRLAAKRALGSRFCRAVGPILSSTRARSAAQTQPA
jgi:glycosyltransferase involved in cell wall biosynthesis